MLSHSQPEWNGSLHPEESGTNWNLGKMQLISCCKWCHYHRIIIGNKKRWKIYCISPDTVLLKHDFNVHTNLVWPLQGKVTLPWSSLSFLSILATALDLIGSRLGIQNISNPKIFPKWIFHSKFFSPKCVPNTQFFPESSTLSRSSMTCTDKVCLVTMCSSHGRAMCFPQLSLASKRSRCSSARVTTSSSLSLPVLSSGVRGGSYTDHKSTWIQSDFSWCEMTGICTKYLGTVASLKLLFPRCVGDKITTPNDVG